jgi:hypothetical protein
VAENLFYSSGTGGFGAQVHAEFPRGRLDVGLLFRPAFQRRAGIRHVIEFRRRLGRDLIGILQTAGEKALTNWISVATLSSTVSTPVTCRAPQNARTAPASTTTNPGQKS